MNHQALPRATEFAQQLLERHLQPGDTVVDATCGNGNDTMFLSDRVGPTGFVLAIDVQASAVEVTEALLAGAGAAAQRRIIVGDHAGLATLWTEAAGDLPRPRAIVFNLGYLPGSDKSILTGAHSTIPALGQAADLLARDGLLVCTCYPGHSGGDDETSAVKLWMTSLPHREWLVACYEMPNQPASPPVVFAAWKRS